MKGCGDVDDALTRTGAARGQRCALPTADAFAHITTARDHHDQLPRMEAAAKRLRKSPGGSDLLRRSVGKVGQI
jgi:hypothetical protein